MINLGHHYYYNEENDEKAEKYYLMAAKKNDANVQEHLGDYYCNIEKNYREAAKYYCMAIKNGNYMSLFILNNIANKHFHKCSNIIAKNIDILQKYLDILKNVNIVGKNYCANCNKHIFLIKLNCCHHICFKCSKMSTKCALCKKLIF